MQQIKEEKLFDATLRFIRGNIRCVSVHMVVHLKIVFSVCDSADVIHTFEEKQKRHTIDSNKLNFVHSEQLPYIGIFVQLTQFVQTFSMRITYVKCEFLLKNGKNSSQKSRKSN